MQVPAALLRRYGLRRGDQLTGTAGPGSPPARSTGRDRRNGPAQNPVLVAVGTVNGAPAEFLRQIQLAARAPAAA